MKATKMALPALVAIAVTVAALWLTNGAVTPKEATWEDVVAEAEKGGYNLINTDEFWERYNKASENLLIVDTRQEWEYRTGHIKNAVNFPMEPTWWSRWQKKGYLETVLGTDKDQSIIFY